MRDKRRPGRLVDQSRSVALAGNVGARRVWTVSMISPLGEIHPPADAPRATAVNASSGALAMEVVI
jgi:hypothetical protein